jgi:hypothetical protein
MQHSFYLDTANGREIIKDHLSPVSVRVYRLASEEFTEDPDMMTCYGDDLGTYLAFEAAYNIEKLPVVTQALKWYATYINHPGMQYQVTDPRPPVTMKVVR